MAKRKKAKRSKTRVRVSAALRHFDHAMTRQYRLRDRRRRKAGWKIVHGVWMSPGALRLRASRKRRQKQLRSR